MTAETFKDLAEDVGALAEPATLAIDAPEVERCPIETYYDSNHRCYWTQNARRGWMQIDGTALRRMLRGAGISNKCIEGAYVTPLESELTRIEREADIDFAGALAGWPKGCHEICGKRILVTTEANMIEPRPGEFPLLEKLLDGLFRDPECDQLPYILGWLKVGIEALYSRQLRPGQVLAIAGERECGKSLFQKIVTEIFGGRAAKPYRYMSGGTDFNSELFGAEHLMIEDEVSTTDGRKRRDFGARIKDFTVNELHSCHPKGRPAITLKPFWRITVTLNDEPECLAILPPIDESLMDKIILVRAHKQAMPLETKTLEGRKQFWARIQAELPAFIHMLQGFRIPEGLECERFGIRYFHHPGLMAALNELSDESKLLGLIDTCLFALTTTTTWTGKADELKQVLCGHQTQGYEAKQLLSWNNATGTYLGRLSKRHPDRIQGDRDGHGRRWTIHQAPSL